MNILDVIKSGDYLVLDTETTGLDSTSEICQIAIIDSAGKVLLDTLVKPNLEIPEEATAIHGISNEMVQRMAKFDAIEVLELIRGKDVIVYNADYDVRMLYQSSAMVALPDIRWTYHAKFHCAMLAFSEIYGDWNDYHQSYRWQKLSTACAYYKIPVTKAHSALEDCLSTLAVCKAMVTKTESIK